MGSVIVVPVVPIRVQILGISERLEIATPPLPFLTFIYCSSNQKYVKLGKDRKGKIKSEREKQKKRKRKTRERERENGKEKTKEKE